MSELRNALNPLIDAAPDDEKQVIEGFLSIIEHPAYDRQRKLLASCQLAVLMASIATSFDSQHQPTDLGGADTQ